MKKWLSACALVMSASGAFAQGKLYLYNWSEYLPDSVIEQFEKETGIDVVYAVFDSNEAMYAKLKLAGDSGYDLAVPSTYYVNKMRKEGLLQPIDRSKLPNFRHLEDSLLNGSYDPGNEYSVPYLWGSTGIAVNGDLVDADSIKSWKDLWDPKYKGQVLLTNDPREVFHLGLVTLGYSGNSTDPKELEQAYENLRKLMPNVRVFNSDSPKEPYLTGEVALGMIWNGEAYMAAQENPAIRYIYPSEGVAVWMDSMVIPKGARNVDNAHAFINFVLQPNVAKVISEEIGYSSPNGAARKLMDEAVRGNRTAYPNRADLKNSEFQIDVGEAITLYEQYWEKLKVNR